MPNVFVVGDAKCGTTSIHRIFELTPGIGTPRTRKELHYFSGPELLAAIEGTHVARVEDPRFAREHVYLVDPLGNLMLRFPRDPDPSRMIKDLQRLLRYSRCSSGS